VKVAKVETFSFAAIADWAQGALARGCEVISDGLACFRAVAEVGCIHQPVIVKGRHPKDLPDFRWINTVISNLKTSFTVTFNASALTIHQALSGRRLLPLQQALGDGSNDREDRQCGLLL
jgi:hypothetical protein